MKFLNFLKWYVEKMIPLGIIVDPHPILVVKDDSQTFVAPVPTFLERIAGIKFRKKLNKKIHISLSG